MKVAVSGASGMIGSALLPYLREQGHEVLQLVRRHNDNPEQVYWDPSRQEIDEAGLAGVDSFIHLSGAGVGDRRWTKAYKQQMWDSRVGSTEFLLDVMSGMSRKPDSFVCGSAIGYYGDAGEQDLNESSAPGDGFLAGLVVEWEARAQRGNEMGIRTTMALTVLVMGSKGGAFEPLKLATKFGVGGPLGSGRQWWSWISMHDEIAALEHLMLHKTLTGPVNLTAPSPERQIDITRQLAKILRRPAFIPAPGFALKLAIGEFAEDILASAKILPEVLLESSFEFTHPQVNAALVKYFG